MNNHVSMLTLFCLLYLPGSQALPLQWEGGTNDVRGGVSHVFTSLPLVRDIYLRVEVYPTDFLDISEIVTGITANSELLQSHCDPREDSGDSFYTCLVDLNVSALISQSRSLTIVTTASQRVNLQPYKGFILYVRYTLSSTPSPTGLPTMLPSGQPSSLPSSLPTQVPTYSMHPTPLPTVEPTREPTAHPTTCNPTLNPSISQKPSGPSYAPTTLYPTLAAGFENSFIGSTNDVLGGVSHTFTGLHNMNSVLLKVEVRKTDFNDPDEYISQIEVNGVTILGFCNPGEQAVYSYHTCLVNFDISNLTSVPHGTATVKTTASEKVNCCPFQGKLLHVRYTITDFSVPTSTPTPMPSLIPTTAAPRIPTAAPTLRTAVPTTVPSMVPTASPTISPSSVPTTATPTRVPSTAGPTLQANFVEIWEGGTNDVRKGVYHTFYGLRNASSVYLKVQVYETDFSDPATEYVDRISAGGKVLSRLCTGGADDGTGFLLCLNDADVTHLVDDSQSGSLTVNVRATWGVNTYKHKGFLLYVRLSVSQHMSPTGMPSSAPSGLPSGEPTSEPTTIPSAEPTGQPSSQPSRIPTSIPTTLPSKRPSAQPTGFPTGNPSEPPTSAPSSSLPTNTPSFSDDAVFVWIGGSGSWSDGSLWNRREPPVNTSTVEISLNINETLLVDAHVLVSTLFFFGPGSVVMSGSSSSLTVSESFLWSGGNFDNSVRTEDAVISLMGNSSICTSSDVYLSYIKFKNYGNCTWTCGNLIVSNVLFSNEATGVMEMIAAGGQTLSIERDVSEVEFDASPGNVLNVEANLKYTYPFDQAVNDIEVADVIRLRETSSSDQLYNLLVESDADAQNYYYRAGAAGLDAFNGSMYIEVVENTDVTICAKTCRDRGWCQSFDFFKYLSMCYLSPFTAAMVGGLTKIGGNDIATFATHYDLKIFHKTVVFRDPVKLAAAARRARNPLNSEVSNIGKLKIAGGGTVGIDIPVNMKDDGVMQIVVLSELVCSLGGNFEGSSNIDIVSGRFTSNGPAGTQFIIQTSSVVHSSSSEGSLSVIGEGHFLIFGSIQDINMTVAGSAIVKFEAGMLVNLRCLSIDETAYLYAPDSNIFFTEFYIYILGNSRFVSRNTTLLSDFINISDGAYVNASGLGHASGTGPGVGMDSMYSASGGSYGGIGGNVYHSANRSDLGSIFGAAYGSTFFPSLFGSGGGVGFNSPAGGSGGGYVAIRSR